MYDMNNESYLFPCHYVDREIDTHILKINLERRPKAFLSHIPPFLEGYWRPKSILGHYFLLGGLPAEPGVDGGPLFDPPAPTVSDAGSSTLVLPTSLASLSTSFSAALDRKRMKPVDSDIVISLG